MIRPNGGKRNGGWYWVSLWWRLLRTSYLRYYAVGSHFMAAAIAFYSLICLAPLGILFAAIVQHILGGGSGAYGSLQNAVVEYGGNAAAPIMQQINDLLSKPGSYVANVVSAGAVAWAGSRLFDTMQLSLAFIWPGRRLRPFLSQKLVSLAMMAVAGLLLSLLVLSRFMIASIEGWLLNYSQVDMTILAPLRLAGSHGIGVALTGVSYLMLYKTIPVQRVNLKAAVAGAVAAAVLWQASLPIFSHLMVRNYQINPIYGSLGGVVIFGLWAFLGGQVLLLGAQVAATYEQVFIARRPGSEDDAFISSARRRVQMTRLPDVAAEAENLLGELDAVPETEGAAAGPETFNVIVLGSARLSPALAERFGVEARGLVPVAGKLSIEWVLDALSEVPEFSQVVIIGNRDAYVHSPAGPRVKGVVEETPDMALNLLRAIRILGDGRRILITAADTPLVTPGALRALLGQCDSSFELCYPVTRPAEPVRRYRLRHYAFLPLRDGRVAHTCHLLVQPALVLRHQEFADRYLSPHRDLVAAAGDIGAMLMVRYLLGWYIPALRYDVASASHSIEAVTGAEKCQAVASDHPEIALSLETPADVQEAEARLQAR